MKFFKPIFHLEVSQYHIKQFLNKVINFSSLKIGLIDLKIQI